MEAWVEVFGFNPAVIAAQGVHLDDIYLRSAMPFAVRAWIGMDVPFVNAA